MPTPARRIPLYLTLNLGFILVAALGCAAGGSANPRLLYVVLLFALCSSCVLGLDRLNGPNALLAAFMLVYFVTYGLGDLTGLFAAKNPSFSPTAGLLDGGEAVILVGGLMWVLGYRLTVLAASAARPIRRPREWPAPAILVLGLLFWGIGTIATYRWYVYIIPDTTDEAFRKGLSSISPTLVTAYLLGQLVQPLGMLLLAYLWVVSRNVYLMVLLVAVVAIQMFIGFVSDSKGLAMSGIILVIVMHTLVGGRLPKAWLAIGLIFVALLYPYFTAYRAAIHGAGVARTSVVANFGEILRKTIAAKDRVNTGFERAQTFFERSNVKGNLEVIVAKAGNGVAFQHGYTLAPILEAFIPKLIRPEKVHIPTGQLFNKQFHLVEGDEVYISPSHLGELYWNFGWPGTILGMGLIGLVCGWVGGRFNVSDVRTVTRVLVTIITIKQLIVPFESTIADCYVVWLRALAGIGLLHLIFARVPAVSPLFKPTDLDTMPGRVRDRPVAERLFPNLLT